MNLLTQPQIILTSKAIFEELADYCMNIPENIFFDHPSNNKWSIAENIRHLVISTNTTTIAYSLPKWIVRWVGGKPNRHSKTYKELVAKYTSKLQEGGRASGRYVPKKISSAYTKEKLLQEWQQATTRYLNVLNKKWTEETLDNYLAPHPLLGKVTLRELCYFTHYHTEHHFNIIKSRIK
jgi:DinB superfamily